MPFRETKLNGNSTEMPDKLCVGCSDNNYNYIITLFTCTTEKVFQ